MDRRITRWITAALLVSILGLAGCGSDSKKGEPKVSDPNAPKLDPKIPSGGPGPAGGPGPGGKPAGPQGGTQ